MAYTYFESKEDALDYVETFCFEWRETLNEIDPYYGFCIDMCEFWLKHEIIENCLKLLKEIERTYVIKSNNGDARPLLRAIEGCEVWIDERGEYEEYFNEMDQDNHERWIWKENKHTGISPGDEMMTSGWEE